MTRVWHEAGHNSECRCHYSQEDATSLSPGILLVDKAGIGLKLVMQSVCSSERRTTMAGQGALTQDVLPHCADVDGIQPRAERKIAGAFRFPVNAANLQGTAPQTYTNL